MQDYLKMLELAVCQERRLGCLRLKTKLQPITDARKIFCMIAAEELGHTNQTYIAIGEYLKCDRNTVRHAVKGGKDMMIYSEFKNSVNNVKNELWKWKQ